MATSPTAPREGRRDATRKRILAVALDLFSRHGFEATSVKAIAEQCAMSDAGLYYYFRSKREILDALWNIPQAERLRDVSSDQPLTIHRLMTLVDEMLLASAEQDQLIRLITRQSLAADRVAVELRNQTMAFWRQYLVRHFETRLTAAEAAEHADLLMMLVLGVTYSGQIDHGAEFPTIVRSSVFREEVKTSIRLALPFCRAGSAPCAPSSSE